MKKLAVVLLLTPLGIACAPKTQVQLPSAIQPGSVDTITTRHVIRG